MTTMLIFTPASMADDLLEVLGDDSSSKTLVDQQAPKARGLDFSNLVPRRTPEMNIFFSFLNNGEEKKALFQWDAAFADSAFRSSPTGVAINGYLKFATGLKVNGIETLLGIESPGEVDSRVLDLWKVALKSEVEIWDYAQLQWHPEWKGVLPTLAEVKIRLKQDSGLATGQLKDMFRRLGSEGQQHVAIIWHMIIDLATDGQEVEAAKLLKKLLGMDQNMIGKDLIQITIGRVLYQKGYLTPAISYYQKVSKASPYWFLAQEEMAWSYLRKGEPQNTLAIAKTLTDDHFQNEVGAEAHYLSALAHLKVCDYSGVANSLEVFRRHFRSRAVELMGLSKDPGSEAVKSTIASLKANSQDRAKISVKKLPVSLFSDRTFKFRLSRAAYLEKEAKDAEELFHQSISEASDTVGFQGKFDQLKNQLQQRTRSSEALVYERVRELASEELKTVKQVLHKMQIVEAELVQQLVMAEQLIRSENDQLKVLSAEKEKKPHTLKFPFDGELWFDELSHYKMDLKGGCQAKKDI